MVLSTAFSQMFGIDYPIVSAPMDLIAGGELAAAVSGAGGLGLIGGGYGDRDWLARQFDLAAGAPVGCGFITWSLARQPQLLDLALQYEPVAVMLSFGDPAVFADAIKSAGTRLVCQIQNRTQAERALQVGADVLVAQGTEAGGHGHGPRSTLTLVPEIVDLVTARGTDIPVIAAGILVGTRFYATVEALSTPQARDPLLAATGDDMCRTTIYDQLRRYPWPQGHTMSVLSNALTDQFEDTELDILHREEAMARYWRAVAARDYSIANVTAGQAAGLVNAVLPAADVITGMAQQAARTLTAMRAV